MVGVRIALAHFDHGSLHGLGLRLSLLEPRVEGDHEVLGAFVVNVPKAEDKRLGSCLEEATHQPDQFVAWGDDIQSGCAAAKDNQLCRQLQVINVVQA